MKISALLLVEDSAEEASAMRRKLALSKLEVDEVVVAATLGQALVAIKSRNFDIVMLDLDLEDSKSLDTLRTVRSVTDTVVIVLAETQDELLGIQALKAGADDFLVKSLLTETTLRSSVIYSMTRHSIRQAAGRMESKLDTLSQMTGAR